MAWLTEHEGGKRVYGGVKADWEMATGEDKTNWLSVADLPLSAVADTVTLPIAIPVALSRRQHEAKAQCYLVGDDDAIRTALLKDIPIGTPLPKAIAFLESIGFQQRDYTIRSSGSLAVDRLSRSHEDWVITVSLFKKEDVTTDLKVTRRERVEPGLWVWTGSLKEAVQKRIPIGTPLIEATEYLERQRFGRCDELSDEKTVVYSTLHCTPCGRIERIVHLHVNEADEITKIEVTGKYHADGQFRPPDDAPKMKETWTE